jgi:hypothetical protein
MKLTIAALTLLASISAFSEVVPHTKYRLSGVEKNDAQNIECLDLKIKEFSKVDSNIEMVIGQAKSMIGMEYTSKLTKKVENEDQTVIMQTSGSTNVASYKVTVKIDLNAHGVDSIKEYSFARTYKVPYSLYNTDWSKTCTVTNITEL